MKRKKKNTTRRTKKTWGRSTTVSRLIFRFLRVQLHYKFHCCDSFQATNWGGVQGLTPLLARPLHRLHRLLRGGGGGGGGGGGRDDPLPSRTSSKRRPQSFCARPELSALATARRESFVPETCCGHACLDKNWCVLGEGKEIFGKEADYITKSNL